VARVPRASANMTKPEKDSYQFGPFRLDAGERRLLRDENPVPLAPKVFDTLLALIENAARLVSKEELINRLWPNTFVEEATLARNISDLRRALGESSGKAKYIETVPKSGYRFVASVRRVELKNSVMILERHMRKRVVVEEELEPEVRSIAVLPFKPLNANEPDEYLGLGLADALITRLSNIRQIAVRPTRAVMNYAGTSQDAAAAGRELKVEAVLDGVIQRSGDRVRLTVQLVSVSTEMPLWADKFDEKFTDIFEVEDSISEQVARALTLRLTLEERLLLGKRYTENSEAYELYLKGRYYWNKRTAESLNKGIEYFKQAIGRDPGYASAYAGMSDSYTLLVIREALRADEGFSKAKAAAGRALEIDDTLAEAHASLAHAMLHNWELSDSEEGFRRAIELNPGYASAHHWYSEYLLATGQVDEAITEVKRAIKLDPLSLVINCHLGEALYFARRYDQSIEQLRNVLEMDSNFALACIDLGRVYLQIGRHEEALAELKKGLALLGDSLESTWWIGLVYAARGNPGEARKVLDKLQEQSKHRHVSPYGIALICAALGDKDQAFELLAKAYESHDGELFNMKVEPQLDNLRSDTRFKDLLRLFGLDS
jgi:TolB-like protein/DNA-binding SARP family transcriptional activator